MAWSPLGPHNIPSYTGWGIETPFGIILPPGSKVAAYVRSGGVSTQDSPEIQSHLVKTLASALSYVRSGRGDTIIVLPGHAENVTDNTMLTNLADGTRILGIGLGASMPSFTWTATGSQWVMDNNGVIIQGLSLNLDGANGVVKAISVTGGGNTIADCDISLASGATSKATIGIEVGAGGNSFVFRNNRVRGTATHNVTDGVLISAAVLLTDIIGNRMIASATAGNGLVRVTAAALNFVISDNIIYNTHTSSTACIAFSNVAADGIVARNMLATKSTGAAASGTEGIAIGGASVLAVCFENYVANDKATSGKLLPTVDT